jgi:predicted transcriptional regulator
MTNWDTFEQRLLKGPAVKKAYDELEPAYNIARGVIGARLAKKLTQAELAKNAGVSREVIARLESGTGNPTVRTVCRVVSALDKELRLVDTKHVEYNRITVQ